MGEKVWEKKEREREELVRVSNKKEKEREKK
jgi:hypothetical protein